MTGMLLIVPEVSLWRKYGGEKMSMSGGSRKGLRIGAVLIVVIVVSLAGTLSRVASGEALAPRLEEALKAVLECERADGGWMYVCEEGVRVAGFTAITRRAERVASALGLARWDLVVLRSPGTPAGGLLLLRAYERTGRDAYLEAVRRSGKLLVNLQLPSGGWFSEMPVYGTRLAAWFRAIAPWATIDDDVTPGAIRFLLALWEVTRDPSYRDAARRGLDLLLKAQLPSGAWPLTWRPRWLRSISPSFEDWPSLNDGATTGAIHALITGARVLNRPELLEAARRGGDWLLRVQAAAPNAGWAQQYEEGDPVPARRFEPVALASWESRYALEALSALAEATGDRRFCEAFPKAVDWFIRSALAPGCWARFYSLGSNAPVYVDREGHVVPSMEQAKRPYKWEGDFGIPAFLASLGFDPTAREMEAQAHLPHAVWRVHGYTEECPGSRSASSPPTHSPSPRIRIAEAASRQASLEPALPGACASRIWRSAM